MPNFWTNLKQQAYECLNGPRTKDYDFDKKLEELNQTKTKINQVKSIMLSFPSRTCGLMELCEDIGRNLPSAFFKDNSYYPFVDDVVCAHKAFQDAYLKCRTAMEQLQKDTQSWDNIFEGIEIDVKQRNELRKVYDHYDDKLEELVKDRNAKLVKNKPESATDAEKFDRNEKKWRESTSQYVNHSNQTYKKMQDLLDSRYTLMVPIIMTFVTNERILFINLAKIFNYFENCQGKFKQMTSQYKKQRIDYNALDFIRGRDLLGDTEVNKNRITNFNTMTTGVIGGNMPPINKKPPSNMGGGGGGDNISIPNVTSQTQQSNTYNEVIQGNKNGYQVSTNQPINTQPFYPPQRIPGPNHFQGQPQPYNQGQPQPYNQGQPQPYNQEQPQPYNQEQPQPYNQEQQPPNQFIPKQSNLNQPQMQNMQFPQQPLIQTQYQQLNQGQPVFPLNPNQQKNSQSGFPQHPNPELFMKNQQQYQPNQSSNNPYQPESPFPHKVSHANDTKEFNPYIDKQTKD